MLTKPISYKKILPAAISFLIVTIITSTAVFSQEESASFSTVKKNDGLVKGDNNVNSMIKGNYTATDFVDGKIKIDSIRITEEKFILLFSNKQVMTITKNGFSSKFQKEKETPVTVEYRGHKWNKKFTLYVDDVCMDDYNKTFFIKFTTNIVLPDCQKDILSFKCEGLLAQFDGPVIIQSGCCLSGH